MKINFKSLLQGKEIKNASWLVGGKIIQMMLSLLIGVLTARYLGPSNYGAVNYGMAFASFFTAFCTLGLNSIIIKDFVDHPNEQGEAIGSALVMRAIASAISVLAILCIVSIVDSNEPTTILVVMLCSLGLIFNIFETFNYWFQSIYKSKITAIATLIAYFCMSIYKVVLLILQKDVVWFAFATSIDYIFVALVLFIAYKKYNGPKLKFSKPKAKSLLKNGYHYIFPAVMVAIYAQTDKLMLKQMLSEADVAYYSTAVAVCGMWTFVLAAIIDSVYPTILKLYEKNHNEFEKKNKQLYAIIFYVSVIVSLIFMVLGKWVVTLLYGEAYAPAILPLKIVTWYTAFSYLGVARNAWIVSENKQQYLKYIYFSSALLNVIINFALIPLWGAVGAALASLITQIFTSIVLPCFIKELRPNAKLMLEAIMLKDVF